MRTGVACSCFPAAAPDPISGTVLINAFNLDTGESDLKFNVTPENPYDHTYCTVNGTLETTGYSF